jgi:hypothetical protein
MRRNDCIPLVHDLTSDSNPLARKITMPKSLSCSHSSHSKLPRLTDARNLLLLFAAGALLLGLFALSNTLGISLLMIIGLVLSLVQRVEQLDKLDTSTLSMHPSDGGSFSFQPARTVHRISTNVVSDGGSFSRA